MLTIFPAELGYTASSLQYLSRCGGVFESGMLKPPAVAGFIGVLALASNKIWQGLAPKYRWEFGSSPLHMSMPTCEIALPRWEAMMFNVFNTVLSDDLVMGTLELAKIASECHTMYFKSKAINE